jgi:hypothetical protein
VLDTLTEKDILETFQKWRRQWDRCLHTLCWVLWFLQRQSGIFWIHPRIHTVAYCDVLCMYVYP